MNSKPYTFHCDLGEVRVTPTSPFDEDREPHPFLVQIIPDNILLPAETIKVEEPYYFCAAAEAVDLFKEKHKLNPTTTWAI